MSAAADVKDDSRVVIYDYEKGVELAAFGTCACYTSIRFTDDGKHVITACSEVGRGFDVYTLDGTLTRQICPAMSHGGDVDFTSTPPGFILLANADANTVSVLAKVENEYVHVRNLEKPESAFGFDTPCAVVSTGDMVYVLNKHSGTVDLFSDKVDK